MINRYTKREKECEDIYRTGRKTMNDEWKMPGTEQEENQQPVGEESEVTEATAVKEPEAGETAKAMPEATESLSLIHI